jgi:AbrB family looped-hinge helix DNA binding protein
MAQATLTTKGQVTIPKEVRDSLQLRSGDKIEIIITKDREAIIRPVSKKVDDIFGKLYKPGRKTISIEEMDQAVQARMREQR